MEASLPTLIHYTEPNAACILRDILPSHTLKRCGLYFFTKCHKLFPPLEDILKQPNLNTLSSQPDGDDPLIFCDENV